MKHLIKSLIILCISFSASGQRDTLKMTGELSLRGVWQTGTLIQLIISPAAKLAIESSRFHMEVNSRYDFFLFNGTTIKNDLWAGMYFQYQPNKTIYPLLSGLTGFSQSYKIEYSTQVALGVGVNIIERKPNRYFQANIGLGYFNLKYTQEVVHNTVSVAPLLKIKTPVFGNKIVFSMDLTGYLPLEDTEYFGLHNQFELHLFLSKAFSIHLNHTTLYNKKKHLNIKPVNTKLVFGVTYSIH